MPAGRGGRAAQRAGRSVGRPPACQGGTRERARAADALQRWAAAAAGSAEAAEQQSPPSPGGPPPASRPWSSSPARSRRDRRLSSSRPQPQNCVPKPLMRRNWCAVTTTMPPKKSSNVLLGCTQCGVRCSGAAPGGRAAPGGGADREQQQQGAACTAACSHSRARHSRRANALPALPATHPPHLWGSCTGCLPFAAVPCPHPETRSDRRPTPPAAAPPRSAAPPG